MDAAPTTGRRVTSLDGLRGLAAAIVVFHHGFLVQPVLADAVGHRPVTLPGWGQALVHTPLRLLWAGTEAVYIFFVLSGLVLVLPYARGRRPDWWSYYPSRFVRLYFPVFAALVFAMVLFLAVKHTPYPGESWWTARHEGTLDAKAAAFAFPLLAHITMLDSPLWSIRWELAFSGLLPLYFYGVRALPTAGRGLVLVGVAAITVWGPTWSVWLSMFAVGVVLAFEFDRVLRFGAALRPVAGTALTVAACLLLVAQWTPFPLPHVALLLSLLGAATLVVLFASWPPLRGFADRRVVQWLGTVSFSLYLTHEPVLVAVAYLLRTTDPALVLAVGAPVAVVVAWAFYRLVESRLHRLAKAVGRAVTGWRTPAVVARGDAG